MPVLATLRLYDPAIHGAGGPDGHFLVDFVWNRADAFKAHIYRRTLRRGLRLELVEVYQEGLYTVATIQPAFRMFQKRLKRRYGTPPT